MSDLNSRIRSLSSASAAGTLKKSLGIGNYTLTGWLGGVTEEGKPEPRVRMETMGLSAKNLKNAKAQYLRQYKNQLPPEAFDEATGLVIIRVESNEEQRKFPAGTPVLTGTVKFFKEQEGFGYVTVDGTDYFIHHNEIVCDDDVFPMVHGGQTVSFIPAERNGQATACSVTSEV